MNIKSLFIALFLLLFSGAPTLAASDYQFEFFDFQTNKTVTTFPFGHANEIIVASQTKDVRNQLPVSLSLKIGGDEKWTATIANTPTKNCRGETGCSIRGPVINEPGTNSYVELTAKNKSDKTLTSYTSGTPPTNTTKDKTPKQQTNVIEAAKMPYDNNNPNNIWFHWWWEIGFWVGILWIFPWVFVGWQWVRLKFWGFVWPWPWWFWIPWFWFIPWLFIAWQWWLIWWPWWAWIWWIFPWIFWVFWWIVIFKEAIIWLWQKCKP